jgi:hypothetical protein
MAVGIMVVMEAVNGDMEAVMVAVNGGTVAAAGVMVAIGEIVIGVTVD